MGEYFTAFYADGTRVWIASSEGGDLHQMTAEQAVEFCQLKEKHETEEQSFLKKTFKGRVN